MRALQILLILGFALCWQGRPVNAAGKPDVPALVTEYVAAATNDSRRLEILAQLELVAPADITASLKKPIIDKPTREPALKLALAMQVRGLFDSVKACYEAGLREAALQYGLLLNEKGASKYFLDLWKSHPVESDDFRTLHAALVDLPLDPAALKELADLAKKPDSNRREQATELLSAHFADTTYDPEVANKNWPDWQKRLKTEGAQQACAGLDLRLRPGWAKTGQRFGANLLVRGQMDNPDGLPESCQAGNFTVTAKLWAAADSEFEVWLCALTTDARTQGNPLIVEGKKCFITSASGQNNKSDFGFERWFTMRWEVTRPAPLPDYDYNCAVALEGSKVAFSGPARGKPHKFLLKVLKGSVIVGPIEYQHK